VSRQIPLSIGLSRRILSAKELRESFERFCSFSSQILVYPSSYSVEANHLPELERSHDGECRLDRASCSIVRRRRVTLRKRSGARIRDLGPALKTGFDCDRIGPRLNPASLCMMLGQGSGDHLPAISMVELSKGAPFATTGSGFGWTASSLRMLEPAIFTSFRTYRAPDP
jgi:hypothetical protein